MYKLTEETIEEYLGITLNCNESIKRKLNESFQYHPSFHLKVKSKGGIKFLEEKIEYLLFIQR
jgi:hypothetical protein